MEASGRVSLMCLHSPAGPARIVKISSSRERYVLQIRAAALEIVARREAREFLEFADEMRLVVIAVALDDLHPVDIGRGVDAGEHALEPRHAQIGLRRHADLLGEKADERLLADLGLARSDLDRDAVRRAAEKIQRQRDCGMMRALP